MRFAGFRNFREHLQLYIWHFSHVFHHFNDGSQTRDEGNTMPLPPRHELAKIFALSRNSSERWINPESENLTPPGLQSHYKLLKDVRCICQGTAGMFSVSIREKIACLGSDDGIDRSYCLIVCLVLDLRFLNTFRLDRVQCHR